MHSLFAYLFADVLFPHESLPSKANHELVEQGLFLSQLKSIGLDVGTMASTISKMKPDKSKGDRPSTTASVMRPEARAEPSYASFGGSFSVQESPWDTPHDRGGGGGFGGQSSTKGLTGTSTSGLEEAVAALQRKMADQDKKLDLIIDLQREILKHLGIHGSGRTHVGPQTAGAGVEGDTASSGLGSARGVISSRRASRFG